MSQEIEVSLSGMGIQQEGEMGGQSGSPLREAGERNRKSIQCQAFWRAWGPQKAAGGPGGSTLSFDSVFTLPSKNTSSLWESIMKPPRIVTSLQKLPSLFGACLPVGRCPSPTCSATVHKHLHSAGPSATSHSFIWGCWNTSPRQALGTHDKPAPHLAFEALRACYNGRDAGIVFARSESI